MPTRTTDVRPVRLWPRPRRRCRAPGQPYPLRIDSAGADAGQIAFTDHGKKVAVLAPPADQTVDVTKLGSQRG